MKCVKSELGSESTANRLHQLLRVMNHESNNVRQQALMQLKIMLQQLKIEFEQHSLNGSVSYRIILFVRDVSIYSYILLNIVLLFEL